MKRFVSLVLIFAMISSTACALSKMEEAFASKLKAAIRETLKTEYESLYYGDKSDTVKKMQERLIELGYLAAGEADGAYGKKTAQAVHMFKNQNGIADSCGNSNQCDAEKSTHEAIMSNSAKRYSEPSLTLGFNKDCYISWTNISGNKLQINVEVFNSSTTRTIKAFELFVYATDVWGECIWGDDFVYRWTTEKNVKPGAEVKSESVNLPDRSDIHTVYIAVKRVKYSDGTTYEVPNGQLNYWHWAIK